MPTDDVSVLSPAEEAIVTKDFLDWSEGTPLTTIEELISFYLDLSAPSFLDARAVETYLKKIGAAGWFGSKFV